MPTVKLSDSFGFTGDVELPEGTGLMKYVRNLRQMQISDLNLALLEKVPLNEVPLDSVRGGFTFERPVGVGIDQIEMTIGGSAVGRLALFGPQDKELFDPEQYTGGGDPVPIPAGHYYLSIGVVASLTAELAREARDLSFGFDPGGQITIACYKPFGKSAASAGGNLYPPFVAALRDTIRDFVILGDLEDLSAMTEGTIATFEGRGHLKFSSAAELAGVVNPLAAVDLPGPIGELQVVSGNSIRIGASFELTGAYQIRVQKMGGNRVRLGYYKKRESEIAVNIALKSGISAGLGNFDLLGQVLRAISKNPEVDQETLEKGGLTATQIGKIEKTLEAGVARKLELSITSALNSLRSTDAAFLFDIDLDRLDPAGRRAIHQALDADLSGLVGDERSLPPGIKLVHSILAEARGRKHTLKINLLGIYNFISVSSLMLKGTVLYEPESGEITITDRVTAARIAATTFNFAADHTKLRRVLAESFLVTAAYRCSTLIAQSPQLALSHSYFEFHSKTNRETIKNNLDVMESLGLVTRRETEALLAGAGDFGRTTFYAETSYDDEAVTGMFLIGGERPRPREEYEQAGRDALKLLVQAGEPDDYRRLPAIDDDLWREMKRQGQFNFRLIDTLGKLKAPQLGAVIADYSAIIWWAGEMRQMGERLAEIRLFLREHPHVDAENNRFKSLRRSLSGQLKEVAGRTKSEFGDPWGLIAMDLATNRSAAARARVTGPRVALTRERAPAQAGGADAG